MADIGSSLRFYHQGSHHERVNLVYLVPVVTLKQMTCWDLSPLKFGSSSVHGHWMASDMKDGQPKHFLHMQGLNL